MKLRNKSSPFFHLEKLRRRKKKKVFKNLQETRHNNEEIYNASIDIIVVIRFIRTSVPLN